jgi:hypothetical protein
VGSTPSAGRRRQAPAYLACRAATRAATRCGRARCARSSGKPPAITVTHGQSASAGYLRIVRWTRCLLAPTPHRRRGLVAGSGQRTIKRSPVGVDVASRTGQVVPAAGRRNSGAHQVAGRLAVRGCQGSVEGPQSCGHCQPGCPANTRARAAYSSSAPPARWPAPCLSRLWPEPLPGVPPCAR